jgi:ankyrin repeat protein
VAMALIEEGRYWCKNSLGMTALHFASINGHTGTAMALIDREQMSMQGHYG